MAARKLRDRLAVAAGLSMTEEPEVKVPASDKVETLREEATKGIDAINALYAERNSSVELAADLNQKLNHVQAVNVQLREENNYYKQRCEYLMQMVARQGAYLTQAGDLFRRIHGEVHQVNAMIESLPQPAPISNNPDLPRVNGMGLPYEEEDRPTSHFDRNGIQASSVLMQPGPPPVDAAELQHIISRIGEQRQ